MTLSFSVAEAPADPSASAGRHVPQDAVAKVGEGDEGLEVWMQHLWCVPQYTLW